MKLALHVDDMLVTSTSAEALREFETVLKQEYKGITVHKGNVLSYLGMELDFSVEGQVTITQRGYVKEVLSTYKKDVKAVSSPHTEKLFDVNEELELLPKDKQDLLRSGTASLQYLAKRTYPDLLPLVSHL